MKILYGKKILNTFWIGLQKKNFYKTKNNNHEEWFLAWTSYIARIRAVLCKKVFVEYAIDAYNTKCNMEAYFIGANILQGVRQLIRSKPCADIQLDPSRQFFSELIIDLFM